MMRNMTQPEPMTSYEEQGFSFISWNSILAGVLAAFIIGLIFNLLGAGIGLIIFSPIANSLPSIGIGTFIWITLTGIVSLYIGGWIATYFSKLMTQISGIIHGLLVSGISILISLVIMTTTVSFVVSGSLNALGNIISVSKSMVSEGNSVFQKGVQEISRLSPELTDQVKKSMPDLQTVIDKIKKEATDLLPKESDFSAENNEVSPEKIKSQLAKLIQSYFSSNDEERDQTQQELIDTLAQATHKTPEQIREKIAEWQNTYENAKEKATTVTIKTSKKITRTIGNIALMNFFILVTGMVAAIMGAMNGIQSRKET